MGLESEASFVRPFVAILDSMNESGTSAVPATLGPARAQSENVVAVTMKKRFKFADAGSFTYTIVDNAGRRRHESCTPKKAEKPDEFRRKQDENLTEAAAPDGCGQKQCNHVSLSTASLTPLHSPELADVCLAPKGLYLFLSRLVRTNSGGGV